MSRSPALGLYLAASRLAGPAVRLLLARRLRRGREDAERLGERFGRAGRRRPDGRLVWLHGASVGEAVSMLPLVSALREAAPAAGLLVTTGTVTSAREIAPRLPPGVLHQFVPVDTAAAVRGFLDHWRPDLAIWIESEFWPRLMLETAARGTPMALVNARVSEASRRRWSRVPAMAARLVGLFRLIVTQDPETAERLARLGAPAGRIRTGGNLKGAVTVPPAAPGALAEAQAAIGGRPVWLAASTHAGEEEAVAAAAAAVPGALLVLAPRHPDRGDAVAAILAAQGLAAARRSRGERPGPDTRVWLADTLGEMGLWYRLAAVAFVGGSLVPRGGHTPFEPAALGPAILHGPHVGNFAPAYAALGAAGGAERVATGAALGAAVARLLDDPERRAAMAAAAAAVRARLAPDVGALAREVLGLVPGGG